MICLIKIISSLGQISCSIVLLKLIKGVNEMNLKIPKRYSNQKENNSISNKYNINSTAHSSVLTNNINHPQTARKITDSFLSKKDKYNFVFFILMF